MVDQYGQLLRQRLGAAFVDLDAAEVSDPELREVLRAREASYTAEQPSGLYDFEPGPPYRRAAGIRGEDYDLAEMTWQERLVMWRRAHAAWERNPWAKGAIRIIRASTVAQGHTMTYRAASVKTVLEAFRTLPENAIEAYDKQFCEQLLIDGELFVRMTPAPVDRASGAPVSAQVVIDPLPPWWVLEIGSEPQFRRRVRAYWVQLFTGDVPERTYPDDGPQEIPAADVLHVPINLLAYERRGRSELLAVLPWLKLYKDWLEDRARINRYKGNIYFHLSVANATAAQISTLRNQYRVAPPPASILVTSDNQKLETVEPKIGAAEVAEDGRQIKLATAAGLNIPEYMFACHSADTEVLSQHGWLTHDLLTDKDLVATVSQETDELRWEVPVARHAYWYSGNLIEVRSRFHDLCITPNHRVWVREQLDTRRKQKGWRFESASQLLTLGKKMRWHAAQAISPLSTGESRTTFTVPGCERGGPYGPLPEVTCAMEDWLTLLAYQIIDGGTFAKGNGYTIYLTQARPEHVARIRALMAHLPWRFRERSQITAGFMWRTENKALYAWLARHVGCGAQHKRIPRFVFDLNLEQRRHFFLGLMDGDGCWNPHGSHSAAHGVYLSVSRALADDVARLAFGLGYAVTSSLRPLNHSGYTSRHPAHSVQIRTTSLAPAIQGEDVRSVPYSGPVYCLTVPCGRYVTRRNGRISIHGNSDAENANLASTRSQEAPANRLFLDYQDVMANLVWRPIYRRVVETAIAVGLVEDEEPEIDGEGEPIIDDVTGEPKLIKALEAFDLAYPPPAKEDPKTLTEALVLQLGQELVSRQTAMQDLGRDPQLEIKRIEAEREADTARAAAGFVSNDDDELDLLGQPGAPDMPGTNGTNGTNGRVPAGSTVGGNTTR